MNKQEFQNKRVLVFGLGLLGGGAGDVRFFSRLGAKVTATDLKSADQLQSTLSALSDYPVKYTLGKHTPEDVLNSDYILRNPSVPIDHPLLKLARSKGIPILMRSSLFASLAQLPIIGITGTRGKTTTTTMIYYLLSKLLSPKKVLLAGNIKDVSDLELLDSIDQNTTYAVMELSSWQLQGFAEAKISPHISVITNLFPDHLNRYSSLEEYFTDKKAIIAHQHRSDIAIFNHHQSEFHHWAESLPQSVIWFNSDHLPNTLHLQLLGEHNRANAAAALAVIQHLGLNLDQAIDLLNQFNPVKYRLESIGYQHSVEYINDTTATTPEATMAALNSLKQSPILILGGADKQLPVESLARIVNQKAKKVILLSGTGTDQIRPSLSPSLIIAEVGSMHDAVTTAATQAKPGDIVLLSPGFASFGLFVNEYDRGDQFNQCVQELN